MNIVKRVWKLLLLCLMGMVVSESAAFAKESKESKEVKVVFTHDLHSHLEPFYLEEDGEEQQVGGFARIMTYTHEQ